MFKPGQKIMCNGFEGVIVRHYFEGMWEVKLPGGYACVAYSCIQPI